jgi:dynein heavy chain
MNLIFFTEAILQIISICRTIKTERGNAMLIGLGGSGRNSLTQLCSFIRGYKIFQIEITNVYGESNWKDDLRKLLK